MLEPTADVLRVKFHGKQVSKSDIEDLISKCKKPRLPEDDECCGTGCFPCVFDTYDTKIEKYEDMITEYESVLLEFEDD